MLARRRVVTIGNMLRKRLVRRHRERLRQAVIAGCKEMADVYLATEREYHQLEEEVCHTQSLIPNPQSLSEKRSP